MSNNPNLALLVLLEAKTEYSKQLTNILTPRLNEGIQSLLDKANDLVVKEPNKILVAFQNMLGNIPHWKDDMITQEYNRILEKSDCSWLDELIAAVFICYTKVLSVIKITDTLNKPIHLSVPTGTYFIHQCYIEIAREIWKNPYIVYNKDLSIQDKIENIKNLNTLIENKIIDTIRKLLPVKTILQEYLGKDYIKDNPQNEDIKKIISNSHKENLHLLVKKNLKEFPLTNDNIIEINNNTYEDSVNNKNVNNQNDILGINTENVIDKNIHSPNDSLGINTENVIDKNIHSPNDILGINTENIIDKNIHSPNDSLGINTENVIDKNIHSPNDILGINTENNNIPLSTFNIGYTQSILPTNNIESTSIKDKNKPFSLLETQNIITNNDNINKDNLNTNNGISMINLDKSIGFNKQIPPKTLSSNPLITINKSESDFKQNNNKSFIEPLNSNFLNQNLNQNQIELNKLSNLPSINYNKQQQNTNYNKNNNLECRSSLENDNIKICTIYTNKNEGLKNESEKSKEKLEYSDIISKLNSMENNRNKIINEPITRNNYFLSK